MMKLDVYFGFQLKLGLMVKDIPFLNLFGLKAMNTFRGKMPNKKIMSPAGGLGHKQAGGFAIVACLFVPHI